MGAVEPIVATAGGAFRGVVDRQTGLLKFLGIPYAAAPVAGLRFMPPAPAPAHAGVCDAARFGPPSAQVFDPHEACYHDFVDDPDASPREWVGSEDSLTLNIWTPALDAARRPVLVWIHGGANWLESSRLPIYHGDDLAMAGDIVFVSLNYRLGVFGFLDLSVIGGGAYAGSHANGLRDQLLALRWIAQNIARFGGDPANITLAGESAGSMDISWLLASGKLNGLVRRVVLMSGVASVNGYGRDGESSAHDEVEGRRRAKRFLADMGISDMGALLALSAEEILRRHAEIVRRSNVLLDMDTLFYPRVRAPDLPCDPFEAAASGVFKPIDVMIGWTEYELGLWLLWDDQLDKRGPHWAARNTPFLPLRLHADLASLYENTYPHETPGVQGMLLLGDAMFAVPSLCFAEAYAAHNPNVWLFQFGWKADARRRALHAADQCFFFGKQAAPGGHALLGAPRSATDARERAELAAAMQTALLDFVRRGDPNASAGGVSPPWPRYDIKSRAGMRFDVHSEIARDPLREVRAWWMENVAAGQNAAMLARHDKD